MEGIKLDKLDGKMDAMLERIGKLESSIHGFGIDATHVRNNYNSIKRELDEMRKEVNSVKSDIKAYKAVLSMLYVVIVTSFSVVVWILGKTGVLGRVFGG